MDHLNHLGWVAQRSYAVGDVVFGLRTNSHAVAEWLDETVGAYAVDDYPGAFYSVWIGGPGKLGKLGRSFHILYRESIEFVRTLDVVEVAEALLSEFDALLAVGQADGVHLEFVPATHDGTTMLLPTEMLPYLRSAGRKVERRGVHLPLTAFGTLDVETGGVVSSPAHSGALERFASLVGAEPHPVGVLGAGPRAEMVCVLEEPANGAMVERLTPGQAAFHVARAALNLGALGGDVLPAVARLVSSARCYAVNPRLAPEEMLDVVVGLSAARDETYSAAT